MESKDDRLVDREERVEVTIGNAVRMLAWRLQRHQIDDVHDPYLQFGRVLAQELDRSQDLQRWHVPATGHHDIRLAASVIAGPWPDPQARFAVPIRARLKRVVDLAQTRLGAVADPKARAAKMVRLSEIQASLAVNKDPKTLAIIGQSFLEIEHA
jgi:hypothetical protein